MRAILKHGRWLALLPFLGMLGGPFFLNRVEPLVLGMPLLLAWLVACVIAAAVAMAAVYRLDPENRRDAGPRGGDRP